MILIHFTGAIALAWCISTNTHTTDSTGIDRQLYLGRAVREIQRNLHAILVPQPVPLIYGRHFEKDRVTPCCLSIGCLSLRYKDSVFLLQVVCSK